MRPARYNADGCCRSRGTINSGPHLTGGPVPEHPCLASNGSRSTAPDRASAIATIFTRGTMFDCIRMPFTCRGSRYRDHGAVAPEGEFSKLPCLPLPTMDPASRGQRHIHRAEALSAPFWAATRIGIAAGAQDQHAAQPPNRISQLGARKKSGQLYLGSSPWVRRVMSSSHVEARSSGGIRSAT